MILIYIDTPQEILRWALQHRLPTDARTCLPTGLAVTECLENAAITMIDVDAVPLSARHEQLLTTPCVGFGIRNDPLFTARVISFGAIGYVSLSAQPEALIATIIAAAAGNRVLAPDGTSISEDKNNPHLLITPRELEVMEALAAGSTCREIGERLGISIKTVDTHRGRLLKKLGVRNNSELTRFAIRYGYTALVP